MRSYFVLFLFLCGCASWKNSGPDPRVEKQDLEDLQSLEETRVAGDFEKLLTEARSFQQRRANSRYFQASRLQEAAALEETNQPLEAENIYRSVREATLSSEPAIAARAEWRLSFTAETLGDDLRALTHLLSAEKKLSLLPEEVARAELPARKAFLLHRMGREDEAAQSVREADRGLAVLTSGLRTKQEGSWLARLYLEMGRSLTSHVDEETYSRFLKGLQLSQRYLLKSINQNDPVWSEKAYQFLRSNYIDLWQFVRSPPEGSTHNSAVELRQRREKQIPRVAEFLSLVEEAQALRPPGSVALNPWQEKFFTLTDKINERARAVLYSNSETMVLTEESRLLNGLRRQSSPPKSPGPKVDAKDPNLQ